jgi:hypothetical protein
VKLSDLTPEDWYARLNTRRMQQRTSAVQWWQYVDNQQPLVYVARILLEQGDRFPPLLINWAELVLSSVEERLILDSFLLAGEDEPIEEIANWWQANDMDEQSAEAHMASMVSGQSFLMIGPGDNDVPLTTIEYEDQVAVEIDPRSRQPVAALKVWRQDGTLGGDIMAVLYLPGGRSIEFVNGKVEAHDGDSAEDVSEWAVPLEDDPSLPSVPVVPMLTTPRRGMGRSDLVSIKPLVDGANQFATNLMAAGEHHAVSRKWAMNVSLKDFVDEEGNQVPLWKIAMGDTWAIPPAESTQRGEPAPEPKVGQFTASDLRNFHESIKMIATLGGSLYGLPPGYMGYSSDNPPSAESILYSLDRLVRRTEKRQLWYGGAHERAARIAWLVMGNDPDRLRRIESQWRSAATPTLASMMDAAVKGVQAGIIDDEQAWIDLRYSQQKIAGLRERKRRAAGGFAADVVNGLRGLDVGVGVNGATAGIGS